MMSVALVLLLFLTASTSAWGEGIPPGAASSGYLLLGESDCYISPDYVALNGTNLTVTVPLVNLPTTTPVTGGSMAVTAGAAWKITCIETGVSPDGKMSSETSVLYTPLQVDCSEHEIALSASAEEIEAGIATPCDGGLITPIQVSPLYEQAIDEVHDHGKVGGIYSITTQYTLQLS